MFHFTSITNRSLRFLWRLTTTFGQLFVLAVLLWNMLRFYPGDRSLPVRLGSYFAPWLLVGTLPALSLALVRKQGWFVAASMLALLLMAGRFSYLLPRPPAVSAGTQKSTLTVMTFNVHYANRNAADIARTIKAEAPDIIAFQELVPDLAKTLWPLLKDDYPYHTALGQEVGYATITVSRYPVTALPQPPGTERARYALVDTPTGEVAVWNIHPPVALDHSGWQRQRTMLATIAGTVDTESRPLLVLGDFNTTDQAENYGLIARRLTSAHQAVGHGFGFTYPDPGILHTIHRPTSWLGYIIIRFNPVVRIDHIFASRHFTVLDTHTVPANAGSDHRPVVATLQQ